MDESLERTLDALGGVPFFEDLRSEGAQKSVGGIDVLLTREMGEAPAAEQATDSNAPPVCLATLQAELSLHRALRTSADAQMVKVFAHGPGIVADSRDRLSTVMATDHRGLCATVVVCPVTAAEPRPDFWRFAELRLCRQGDAPGAEVCGDVALDNLQAYAYPRGSRGRPLAVDGHQALQISIRVPSNTLAEARCGPTDRFLVAVFSAETCLGVSEPLSMMRDAYLPFYRDAKSHPTR